MEKSSVQRDLEDWEFLSDDGFLDLGHQETGKSVVISKGSGFSSRGGLVDVNYFVCPPHHPPHLLIGATEDLILATKNKYQSRRDPDEGFVKEIREIEVAAPPAALANQEVISQVFFRKLGENEFVDMKLDSPPKSPTSRGVKPPLMELPGGGRFEGKGEETGKGETHKILSEENEEEEEGKDRNSLVRSGNNGKGSWENFGFGIWKWKITGAGALCSIGVAAATIFIFILSGPQRQRQQQQQSQKIQFQVYPDEKSIKQVVQQATRLNQAISVVRGVPVTRAHISFGGYYDGL